MGKSTDIISVFTRGNQEMFHSAFLAWLMDKDAPHGIGQIFLQRLLSRFPKISVLEPSTDYEVFTEYRDSHGRYDILVREQNSCGGKGIVFENKVKSFGSLPQLDRYKEGPYAVAVIALLKETLDPEIEGGEYPVIEYATIRDILGTLLLSPDDNPYHFIIKEYAAHLGRTLGVFDKLRDFMYGNIQLPAFLADIETPIRETTLTDNDIRTFNYFYYYNFSRYLIGQGQDLVFGSLGYNEAGETKRNTRWISEKNMQGPPYMEALIFTPFEEKQAWRMHPCFEPLYSANRFVLAPRLELWLDLSKMVTAFHYSTEAGRLMLGTWSDDLKQFLSENEPYKTQLKRLGSRNFHHEKLSLEDLPFPKMADRMRSMLSLLFLRT
jgi:hypothetical protein